MVSPLQLHLHQFPLEQPAPWSVHSNYTQVRSPWSGQLLVSPYGQPLTRALFGLVIHMQSSKDYTLVETMPSVWKNGTGVQAI
jgi:hypothetical protein